MPTLLASLIVFVTSAGVLVLEILAGRLLAPYVGVTLETYTGIIGTVLAGIALGNWQGGRIADTRDPRTVLGPAIALGGVLALACLPIIRFFGPALGGRDPVAIVLLAFLGFFAPAAVLSTVTPMVVKVQLDSLRMTGRTVGRLSAVSTAGALLGTFVTGFVLLAAFPTPPIVVTLGALLAAGGIALWTWLPRGEGVSQPPLIVAAVVLGGLGLVVGTPCEQETAYFCATVLPDPEVDSGRLLILDTLQHSYVDLDDPTRLEFDYARAIVDVIDARYPQQQPLDVLHIGGGGFTLPRYLDVTRPGSDNLVLELDPDLVRLARERLGLRTSERLRVRTGDARLDIADVATDSRDVVVGDAFGGLAVPWHLTTSEFIAQVDRVLRPGGIYVLNMIDHPPLAFARAEAATVAAAFPRTVLVAPQERIAGREGGNFVLAGGQVDAARIQERLDARDAPERAVEGAQLRRFTRDARILIDDHAPVDQLLEPRPTRG